MNDLSIELTKESGSRIVAVDTTRFVATYSDDSFDDTRYYVSYEFLVYDNNKYPSDSTVVFKDYIYQSVDSNISVINIPMDGKYKYYKFMIPKLDRLAHEDSDGFYDIFKIKDQVFYYKDRVYLGLQDLNIEADDDIRIVFDENISTVLSSNYSIEIDNLIDV